MGTGRMGDDSPAVNLANCIMPCAVAGGIYDFSGTQASHVYAEEGQAVPVEEVKHWSKGWWDGSSSSWSSEEEYNDLIRKQPPEYMPTIAGENFVVLRRTEFPDTGGCHAFTMKTKTPNSKRGAIMAHSDYTVVVAIFDDDKAKMAGPLNMACQQLMEAYKEAGY